MIPSRRGFLGAMASLAAAATLDSSGQVIQQRTIPPDDDPNSPFGQRTPMRMSRHDPRQYLKANQEAIRKDVAKLAELVADLQKQLGEHDTKEVLSLDVIHKTDEIDKLARQIKSLVVG